MPTTCFLRSRANQVATTTNEQAIDSVVVLRVKLHCPTCVTEVQKCLLSLNGVVDVHVDASTSMITVRGKGLQSSRLSYGLKRKMGRKSEILVAQGLPTGNEIQPNMTAISPHPSIMETIPTTTTTYTSQGTQLTPHDPQTSQIYTSSIPQTTTTTTIIPTSNVYQQTTQQLPDPNTTNITPQESHLVPISTISTKSIVEDTPGTQVQVHPRDMPTNQVFHHYEQRRIGEGPQSSIEIKQQMHTIVHGWPSHVPFPQTQYYAPIATAHYPQDYYICYPEYHYQGLLSDENPNSCKIM